MIRCYLAPIDPVDYGFRVAFPGFPGCTASGDTVAAIVLSAAEKLQAQVNRMQSRGADFPEPSALDARVPRWLDAGVDLYPGTGASQGTGPTISMALRSHWLGNRGIRSSPQTKPFRVRIGSRRSVSSTSNRA